MPTIDRKIVVETSVDAHRGRDSETGRYIRVPKTTTIATTTFYKPNQVKTYMPTKKKNDKLHMWFADLRMLNNPNAYTVAGSMHAHGVGKSLAIAVADKAIKTIAHGLNIGADIYSSSTGETTKAQNFKNIVGAVTSPANFIIQSTYGVWLQEMRIKRENKSLSYYRGLTGNIVNTKEHGNY